MWAGSGERKSRLAEKVMERFYLKEEAIEVQKKIRKKLILKDSFSRKINVIAGVDQAFLGDEVISAMVACDYSTMEIVKRDYTVSRANFPYVPGFLSFREGPPIIKTFNKFGKKPDVLLIDGNGILHPRGIGLASHVGVLIDVPTIGIAKNLLCGRFKEPKRVGDHSPIIYENKTVGHAYKSKKGCKLIFVSPGHKMSLETSLKIIKNCLRNHKIPEPLFLAHKFANELKIKVEKPKK